MVTYYNIQFYKNEKWVDFSDVKYTQWEDPNDTRSAMYHLKKYKRSYKEPFRIIDKANNIIPYTD
ncbi:MAG: hypothetical protein KC414_04985, partial [Romboutsia sp.]|nr:hypothetical protein [Romboutsia sp.]